MKLKWMLFFMWSVFVNAQLDTEPVVWETQLEKLDDTRFVLVFNATIASNWHLYSQFSNDQGALPTEFVFDSQGYKRIGEVEESLSITDYDKVFEMDLTYFNDSANFRQEIVLEDETLSSLSVELNYQACDDKLCIFRSETFVFSLDGTVDNNVLTTDTRSQELSKALKL
ncbi:protein-disulfide reductase DsbD N-terminal domain-containing protein, partial [Flavobacteriaceae bacterium]|nr:protein-disulfide reductase DsbD N-terminal domain-containing protein [Flavobacteriaceae bacterium]